MKGQGCSAAAGGIVFWIATSASAGPVEDLEPGHWFEVPDSHLEAAEKKPEDYPDFNGSSSPSYNSYQRNAGVRAVVENWSGATFDAHEDRLLVWGGGHNGYGGNELYAFGLDTLSWERLTDPTVDPNRCTEMNDDGTPVSRHTYAGLAYVAHVGRLFASGGAADCGAGGCGLDFVWTFDFGGSSWQNMQPTGNPFGYTCEASAVYDPVTELVYYHAHGWWEYDYEANTLTERPSFNSWGRVAMAIDPVERVVIELGDDSAELIDLEAPDRMAAPLPLGGVEFLRDASNPGLQYDDVLGRIVAWDGGATVYSFDAAAQTWEAHDPAPTNNVTPTPVTAAGGTYGRFAYSLGKNIYVLVNAADQNVFLYKLAPGSGTPPPDPSGDESGSGDGGGGSGTTSGPSDDGASASASDGGTSAPGETSPASGSAEDSGGTDDGSGGCGCRTSGHSYAFGPWLLLAAFGIRRRRD